MTIDIHSVLETQLKLKRALDKQNVMRMAAKLNFLAPLFVRHLHSAHDYPSLWTRVLVKELRNPNCEFKDVMEIIESDANFDVDEFMTFGMRATMLAGIDLATDNEQDFWKASIACENCEMCSRGYRAYALSACVLLKPFELELCLEIAHQGDLALAHFTEPMWESLDALIPVS